MPDAPSGLDADGTFASGTAKHKLIKNISPKCDITNRVLSRTFGHNFHDAYRAEQNLSDRAAKTAWKTYKPTLDRHQVEMFGHIRHQ